MNSVNFIVISLFFSACITFPTDYFKCIEDENIDDIIQLHFSKEGFDKTIRGDNGYAIIHTALIEWERKNLKILLDQNISLSTKTPQGETPLMLAAALGNLDAVKLLVERGAQVNVMRASDGSNALSHAYYNGHHDIIEFLKKYESTMGACPHELSFSTQSQKNELNEAWKYCTLRCNLEGIKKIISLGFVPTQKQQIKAVCRASSQGKLHVVEYLYAIKTACPPTVIQKIKQGLGNLLLAPTDLMLMSEEAASIVDYSLSQSKKESKILTPTITQCHILTSLIKERKEALDIYMRHGKKLCLPQFLLDVALRMAVDDNAFYAVQYLIYCGARADKVMTSHCIMLEAAKKGSTELMDLLANAGANIHAKCKGATALDFAIINKNYPVAHWLIHHGINVNEAWADGTGCLHQALHVEDNPELITTLLAHGADPHQESSIAGSPLFYAAYCKRVACCKVLLAAGASYDYFKIGQMHLMTLLLESDCPHNLQILKCVLIKGASTHYHSDFNEILQKYLSIHPTLPVTQLLKERDVLLIQNRIETDDHLPFLLSIIPLHTLMHNFNYWPSLMDFTKKYSREEQKKAINEALHNLLELRCYYDWRILVQMSNDPCATYELILGNLKQQKATTEITNVTKLYQAEKIRQGLARLFYRQECCDISFEFNKNLTKIKF